MAKTTGAGLFGFVLMLILEMIYQYIIVIYIYISVPKTNYIHYTLLPKPFYFILYVFSTTDTHPEYTKIQMM